MAGAEGIEAARQGSNSMVLQNKISSSGQPRPCVFQFSDACRTQQKKRRFMPCSQSGSIHKAFMHQDPWSYWAQLCLVPESALKRRHSKAVRGRARISFAMQNLVSFAGNHRQGLRLRLSHLQYPVGQSLYCASKDCKRTKNIITIISIVAIIDIIFIIAIICIMNHNTHN